MSAIMNTLKAVAPASANPRICSGIVPAALWPKSMIDFRAAFSMWALKRSTVLVGGWTLGMSRIVVTPPAAAARVPVVKSSLCVNPGSRK
jgi:hypothetical protein